MSGWICLHRALLNWEWYTDINATRLFVHCLLKANHKDRNWQGKTIPRGSFITGRQVLAKETGLTEQQIRTALTKLKSTNEITIKSTNKNSLVTLVNYGLYQDKGEASTGKKASKSLNGQPTDNQRITTTNNDNNKTSISIVQQVGLEDSISDELRATPSKVMNAFNEILGDKIPKIRTMTPNRIKHMKARVKDLKSDKDFHLIDEWVKFFTYLRTSCPFFIGETPGQLSGENTFVPDFDWLVKPDNFIKCVEGKYEQR